MKNLIVLLFMTGFILVSCSEGENDHEPKKVEIELTTNEALNKFFTDRGLEPFPDVPPPKVLKIYKEYGIKPLTYDQLYNPSNYSRMKCTAFEVNNSGDFNSSGVFTTLDIYEAQLFVNENGEGEYEGINQSAFEFGQMSSIIVGPGFQHNELNLWDCYFAHRAILGYYCY